MPDKPYNNGTWTAARFHSFIKGGLRSLTNRWGPKHSVLKKARVDRGVYKCAGYEKRSHNVPVTIKEKTKRIKNVFVDHIEPVIGSTGFTTWDEVIRRMFVEADGLQVLCKECHDRKTKNEREQNAVAKRPKQ